MSNEGNRWIRLKGRLTRSIANAAGDRHSEAKAELEEFTGRKPDEATVDAVEKKVRVRHHDMRRKRPRRRA